MLTIRDGVKEIVSALLPRCQNGDGTRQRRNRDFIPADKTERSARNDRFFGIVNIYAESSLSSARSGEGHPPTCNHSRAVCVKKHIFFTPRVGFATKKPVVVAIGKPVLVLRNGSPVITAERSLLILRYGIAGHGITVHHFLQKCADSDLCPRVRATYRVRLVTSRERHRGKERGEATDNRFHMLTKVS